MRVPFSRPGLGAGLLLAATLGGCVFAHDDQGRDLTIGFVTPLPPGETRGRTLTFFRNEGYGLVDAGETLVRAEKVRPLAAGGGQQRDVLTVTIRTDVEGTRVSVHAVTFLIENGQTRQASQTSSEVGRDQDRLIQFLMGPRP